MKKIVLLLIALMLVSCMPNVPEKKGEDTPPPPPPVEEEEDKEEDKEVNPIVGYWTGRNEFVRFKEDGTFQFTKVYFGGNMDIYNGEWSMDDEGKLTAMYVRKSGTLNIDTYVAKGSELRWRSEDQFDYPNPYGGTYYFTRTN